MRTWRMFLLALTLASAGCAPVRELPSEVFFRVDVEDLRREAMVEAANQAADEWRACGVVEVWLTTLSEVDAVPIVLGPVEAGRAGVTVGWDGDPRFIRVSERYHWTFYRSILAHEMGHALMHSVSHLDEPGNVMSAAHDSSTLADEHVTEADCAFLRRLRQEAAESE